MKRVLVALLAISMLLGGMVPQSHAIKPETNLGKQEEGIVVKNVKGEDVGTIRGALEDPMGNIAFVIVRLNDGNKGKKEKKEVVLPVNAFSQDSESDTFILGLSREAITSAPEFNESKLDDPAYASNLYSYYGLTPPWIE